MSDPVFNEVFSSNVLLENLTTSLVKSYRRLCQDRYKDSQYQYLHNASGDTDIAYDVKTICNYVLDSEESFRPGFYMKDVIVTVYHSGRTELSFVLYNPTTRNVHVSVNHFIDRNSDEDLIAMTHLRPVPMHTLPDGSKGYEWKECNAQEVVAAWRHEIKHNNKIV